MHDIKPINYFNLDVQPSTLGIFNLSPATSVQFLFVFRHPAPRHLSVPVQVHHEGVTQQREGSPGDWLHAGNS